MCADERHLCIEQLCWVIHEMRHVLVVSLSLSREGCGVANTKKYHGPEEEVCACLKKVSRALVRPFVQRLENVRRRGPADHCHTWPFD